MSPSFQSFPSLQALGLANRTESRGSSKSSSTKLTVSICFDRMTECCVTQLRAFSEDERSRTRSSILFFPRLALALPWDAISIIFINFLCVLYSYGYTLSFFPFYDFLLSLPVCLPLPLSQLLPSFFTLPLSDFQYICRSLFRHKQTISALYFSYSLIY